MTSLFKKTSLFALVLGTSWLGVVVGQSVTRQIYTIASFSHTKGAQLATGAQPDEEDASSTEASAATGQSDKYENLELFQKVLHFVENNYVDEVKNKDLVYGAIKGMLETLDPHSNFLPPEVFKEMKVDTTGKFGGLGIEIGLKDNVLTVIAPIEDTPAWKAGLRPNDRIVKIDKESTKGMTLTEAVSKMRGKPKTNVTLSIYRDGFDKIKDVSVTRDIIKIQSVKSEAIEPNYGWVRLTNFNESAAADIKKAIEKLQSKSKLRGLVLDLRTNPGGLLDQAVEVSSLFMDDGVIVSTIGRNKNMKDVKYARKGNAYKDFPVAVLVNSSTASAAEIVAGALQDHHRGIIMGTPTFGKGSVQTVIELGQDMGLKLTIARYYTPSGRSIQEKGVQPDIQLDDFDPKLLAEAKRKGESVRERDLKGHIVNEEGSDDEAKAEGKSGEEYNTEELKTIGKDKKGDKKDGSDDMAPVKFVPKEDYQIREAINYLKSYDVFKKLTVTGGDAEKAGS